MPRDLVRYQQTGHLHFLTFSCHGRRPYLATSKSRDLFEHSLEQTRRRFEFFLLGYVLMPEHVHLLLTEPRQHPLAKAIQSLKLSFARQREERPFWLPRYYDFNVYSEDKRLEKLRYIHRNPVVRGLVDHPKQWLWSSFNHCATGIQGVVEIESHWTATQRERTGKPHPNTHVP